ncbi:MAG TPA: MJ0042-type zinc finger domain-containing protein [Sphingomicrobium sp.]|jgi:predicted Zn finger-like uncharacterized protein
MILTCPSCGTQYVVKDGAIPPAGRQVRCASCKHSWHQNPEEAGAPSPPVEEVAVDDAAVEEAPAPTEAPVEKPPVPVAEEDESLAEATLIEPRSGPEAEERAYEEATVDGGETFVEEPDNEVIAKPSATYANSQFDIVRPQTATGARQEDWREPPQPEAQEDDFTPYAAADDAAPPKRGPWLAILIVIVTVVALAAAFWFLAPPELKARLGLAAAGSSPLALVTTHMDRQRLESGNELLTVTGRVINPTGKQQEVPPLQAQLKTRAGKVVYSWTIAPPAPTLAPGESKSFNSAEVSVPPGGEELTITLGGAG